MKMKDPDWDAVLSAASRLQGCIPEAVLVGGTASAIYAAHRRSYDADHVVPNLREEFDDILEKLESVVGWKTARIKSPVLVLGNLDGVDTGIRQLIRSEPLETNDVFIKGQKIVVPSKEEILRIKGALILKRNAMRDYVDFAALSNHLGATPAAGAFERFDALYPQENGQSPTQQLCLQLSDPLPYDLSTTDLRSYKHLIEKWRSWDTVKAQCIQAGNDIFEHLPPVTVYSNRRSPRM